MTMNSVHVDRLVALALYCHDLSQPAELLWWITQLVEHLFHKQYIVHGFKSHLSTSFFSFSMEQNMFRLSYICCHCLIYVGLTVSVCVCVYVCVCMCVCLFERVCVVCVLVCLLMSS